MDNLTHTLIGITLAKAFTKTLRIRDPKIEKAAFWTAIIGNNLPDLDFILRPFQIEGSLEYLLYHRGYTHTLLLAIPLGLLSTLLGNWISVCKHWSHWKLYLLGIISVVFHIGADYCNNYGVHPLSPFLNSWFYGDSIFIVEPLLWITILPYLFFETQSKWGQRLILLLGGFITALILSRIFTPWPVTVALVLWAAINTFIQMRHRSLILAFTSLVLLISCFFYGSVLSKREAHSILKGINSNTVGIQVSASPAPGNPFCWSIVDLSIESKTDYVARTGILSLAPKLFPPTTCYFGKRDQRTDLLTPVSALLNQPHTSGIEVLWLGEFRRPLREFETLKTDNCRFRTFLKFSRIPIWYTQDQKTYAEDLRYANAGRRAFTRLQISPGQECPKDLPPWEPPTQNL